MEYNEVHIIFFSKIKFIGNKLPNYIKSFKNNNSEEMFEEIFDEIKNDNININSKQKIKKDKNYIKKNPKSIKVVKNNINYNSNEVPKNYNTTLTLNEDFSKNNNTSENILPNSVNLLTNNNNNNNAQKINKKRQNEIYSNRNPKKNYNNTNTFSEINANGINNAYNSIKPNLDKIKNRINNALLGEDYKKVNHQLTTTKYVKNNKNKKKIQNEIYQNRTNFRDILEEKIGEKIIEIDNYKTTKKINPNEFCDYRLSG